MNIYNYFSLKTINNYFYTTKSVDVYCYTVSMMMLKTIKNNCDDYFARYVFKTKDLLRKLCNLSDSATLFFLGNFYFGQVFLCNSKIYVVKEKIKYSDNSEPVLETMELYELHEITLLNEYPKTADDIKMNTIISAKDFDKDTFIQDIFIPWIDEPCDLNYEIDNPYYEVIKYLNSYTKETFRTDRYLFYPKSDSDLSFVTNIYAYDLKNQTEMKLYIPYKWNDEEQKAIPPQNLYDVTADDFGKNISNYQKRQCKKAFLELANEGNEFFGVKNYWVMELVKQTIQPVLVLHEWSSHRCFTNPKLFGHIWVYDFPTQDEEPSFFITDEYFTKVAVLKFKSPEYLIKGMYKREMAKAKGWQLNEQEINELIEFLNSPSDRADEKESGKIYRGYKKYVKTNWQQLIFEYNHNTAGWGWDETNFDIPPETDTNKIGDIEALPFNLPIPDYTKLAK